MYAKKSEEEEKVKNNKNKNINKKIVAEENKEKKR